MAKKKIHYYIILYGEQVHVFCTLASAQVEAYYILKEATGDADGAKKFINTIDKNFQTPPYPPKQLPVLDVDEINRMINNIALGA